MNRACLALIFCVVLLFGMGLVMVFNTTSAEVLDRGLDRSTTHALIKQVCYSAVGFFGAFLVWKAGYHKLIKMSGGLLIVGCVFLLLVFVPGIGQQLNGANRWINLLGLSFQPSEIVKYLIPLYAIFVFSKAEAPLTFKQFLILLGKIAVPTALILIEPDNGTVFILIVTLVVLFVLTKLKWVYWALPLCILTLVGGVAASQMSHVPDRIRIYLHPELDIKGKGHQPHQAKIAAGSGRLAGRGLGESLQKLNYLPEARSDYIAAIFAEEFGFIGMMLLMLIYMLIGCLGFYIAANASDTSGFYLASVLTFLLCFQAFLNLGVVSGLLPSKGTNLPFFSHGGSSLLANFLALSLLLNVAKEKTCPHPQKS
ncbi:MAG: cell division protein FtsW [Chlamydiales bacterium]|nr:cell division protein FtsW [Chlamydiales bacterium]